MRMEAHSLPLAESERPRLLPDRVRHADAAEVVRERGAPHESHGSSRETHAPGGCFGELGHTRRVLAEPGRLEPGERGDRREGGVELLACDPHLRKRLDLEGLLPHPRLVQVGKKVVEILQGEAGEARVVRGACSTFDDGPRLLRARGGEEERDVPPDVQETHRQRNLVAAGVREPASVPAREDVLERCLDARTELEPPGEPLRHLAHRCERLTRPRCGVGDGVLDERVADLRLAANAYVRTVERKHLSGVDRVDEEERRSVRNVVAEQLRRLVPVRRAPGRVEKRDVVRVEELLRGRSGELAQTDGQHGRAQGVLQRLPGAEVGGERQGADHLGSTDRLLACRQYSCDRSGILRRHVDTLLPYVGRSQRRPTVAPAASTSIRRAAASVGSPGIVCMSPQTATIHPAPV